MATEEAKRERSNFVVRRVQEARIVDVYEFNSDKLTKLDRIEVSGAINEKSLAEKYGVKKVITIVVGKKVAQYGVPIDEFMENAVLLKTKTIPVNETEEKAE